MAALPKKWHIPAMAKWCSVTGAFFRPDDQVHTFIYENEDGSLRREDLSEAGMEARPFEFAQTAGKPFSSWKSRFSGELTDPEETAEAEAEEKAEQDRTETLFRELEEASDAPSVRCRYIIGLMLERRRILKQRDTRYIDGEGKLLIYEHRDSGEVFVVEDPALDAEEVPFVQMEVSQMLRERLEEEAPGDSAKKPAESGNGNAGGEPAAHEHQAPVPGLDPAASQDKAA